MSAASRFRAVSVATAACLLVLTLATTQVSAQEASGSGATLQQINERNDLIANQEELLNVYRCLFNIDTEIVPGGCEEGHPRHEPAGTDVFSGTPTPQELGVRDELIANQEALLNVYRCLFNIDTEIVPGGCSVESEDDLAVPEADVSQTEEERQRVELVYGKDPAGLIAFSEIIRAYSRGPDYWVVWSCDTPAGQWEVPPEEAASGLEGWAKPYYTWLSGGMYVPEFIAGRTIEADDQQDCLNKVRSAETLADMDGAVIVIDIPLIDCEAEVGCRRGWGEPGRCFALWSNEWIPDRCSPRWPENKRELLLGAVAVTSVPGQTPPNPNGFVLVHEMGHALLMPHSYDRPDRYFGSNLMDFMGNGQTLNFGTPAINRYAAGWIPLEEVAIHREPVNSDSLLSSTRYELYPLGSPGPQMLVIPTETAGVFYTLGARERSGFDRDIPVEGVEVYYIDQSEWCEEIPWENPLAGTCFGIGRLQDAYVSHGRPTRTVSHRLSYGGVLEGNVSHVYGAGEEVVIGDTQIRIISRTADGAGYIVQVGPAA